MTEEHVKYLKETYQNYHEAKIEYNELNNKKDKLQSELKEMENNEIIKQYLIKKREFNTIESDIMDLLKNKGRNLEYDIDSLLYFLGSNNYPNDFFVCVGEYNNSLNIDRDMILIECVYKSKKLLPINSNDSTHKVYINIECGTEFILSKNICTDFENRKVVLYPSDEDPFEFYKKVRLMFFKTCVNYNQEEAIAKVLELRKGK